MHVHEQFSSYYIVASYDEGRQKARKGEFTSDIQTEEEDETKRPKRYVICICSFQLWFVHMQYY